MQKSINHPVTKVILGILFVGVSVLFVQLLVNLLGSILPPGNPIIWDLIYASRTPGGVSGIS